MRDKLSSSSKAKRRRRSSSSSSSEPKRSRELSDLENYPSKQKREQLRKKSPSTTSESESDVEIEKNNEKKLQKRNQRRSDIKESDSEDDRTKKKSLSLRGSADKYKSTSGQTFYKDYKREREGQQFPKYNQQEHDYRLPSKSKHGEQHRRRERSPVEKEDESINRRGSSTNRDRERYCDTNRRMQQNDRSQNRREKVTDWRKNAEEDYTRKGDRISEGRDGRRNRWSDGGEGSRSGFRRRHRPNEEDSNEAFDPNRPIKKEPGLNDNENENYEWGRKRADGSKSSDQKGKDVPKEKPNFGLSGKLAEDTNTFNGVVIKYSEPPEARKPRRRWRLYVFKGEENLPTLYLHRQSAFLIGRDRKVVDIAVDHPACSKQHAAFQFRLVPYERPNGTMGKRVRPYIIDLESANGTYVNNNRIESKKYVELLERDVIKFGFSSREYVLLHEQSKESEAEDDDVADA